LPFCLLGVLLDLDAFAIRVLTYYDPVLLFDVPPRFLLQLVLPRFHYVAAGLLMFQSIHHLVVKELVLLLDVPPSFLLQLVLPRFHYVVTGLLMFQSIHHLVVKELVLLLDVPPSFL
jgi:hypothetical protein